MLASLGFSLDEVKEILSEENLKELSLCRDGPFHERRVYDVCKKGRQGVPYSV